MSGPGAEPRCSFCERPEHMVRRLIAGSDSVYICDACVLLYKQILEAGAVPSYAGHIWGRKLYA